MAELVFVAAGIVVWTHLLPGHSHTTEVDRAMCSTKCRLLHVVAAAWLVVVLAVVEGCTRAPRQPEQDTSRRNAETALEGGGAPATEEGPEVEWELTSAAFAQGERIPPKYTGDGQDISPPLSWTDPPEGARELALICDDPDAPMGTWNHWVLYGLAPGVGSLPEGVPAEQTVAEPALKQGMNTWPKVGYGGPAPPPGKPHRYQFTVYALDVELDLQPGATKDELLGAMQSHILAQATLEGTYSR